MVIFTFLKFGKVKLFEILQTISNMKMIIFQIKIFNEITLFLFMIYNFKVLVSLPKSFHGPLGLRMYCNWPTDHAIDHSSVGLRRLTIQSVFNEVSLFTFSKGTHGFDVMVPKNYLKVHKLLKLLSESKSVGSIHSLQGKIRRIKFHLEKDKKQQIYNEELFGFCPHLSAVLQEINGRNVFSFLLIYLRSESLH